MELWNAGSRKAWDGRVGEMSRQKEGHLRKPHGNFVSHKAMKNESGRESRM